MKKLFSLAVMSVLLSCVEVTNTSANKTTKSKPNKPTRYYLDKDNRIYHKGDTLTLNNGNKYLKVYGVTGCKYGCPVLIEVK